MKKSFLERLKDEEIIILDGATGTNLQAKGLSRGLPGEVWVLEKPEKILELETQFIEAGSEIILTCTFGASRVRLEHTGLHGKCEIINREAVAIAKKAVGNRDVYIAGSIGPTGLLIKPLGPLDENEAADSFAEQAQFLTDAGVDLLVLETQFDLGEAKAALTGIARVSKLPVVCSFSFDRGTRTMMGVKPSQFGEKFTSAGVIALGINCGRSLEDNLKSLAELRKSTSLPIWYKPNAGLPQLNANGNSIYSTTPEIMANDVPAWISNGAKLIGECCGTSPEHLKAIAVCARSLKQA